MLRAGSGVVKHGEQVDLHDRFKVGLPAHWKVKSHCELLQGEQMSETTSQDIRSSARQAIETLPENSTWEDVIYRIYVRQKIEEGLADAEAGRFVDETDLRQHLGLKV